jgi:hypothetical protein
MTAKLTHLIWARAKSTAERCLWWNPNEQGYTYDVEKAGLYTESDATKMEVMSAGDCVAVPVSLASVNSRNTVEPGTMVSVMLSVAGDDQKQRLASPKFLEKPNRKRARKAAQ